MKKNEKVAKLIREETKLPRKVLREIERELGVYLDKPTDTMRNGAQQFGVYDEDEVFVGNISAESGKVFAVEELKRKILALFQD